MIPQALFFFLKIVWDLLCFYTNFRIICSSSVKNVLVILIRIALTLQIALGSMVILTVLILPIHEHCISFHLFVSSFFFKIHLSIYLSIYLFIFGCVGSSLLCMGFLLVAASKGYSSLRCVGFSLQWPLLLWSMGSRCTGFSNCGTQAQ